MDKLIKKSSIKLMLEAIKLSLNKKVDKVDGKQLSSNDYTTTEKTKLAGIESGATAVAESTVSGWGFTKNTGTYSKPSGGIPASDLASGVLPTYKTISLPKASWTGSTSPYSQLVTITGVTSTSRIDLQPTATQIAQLMDDETTLTVQNDNGTITAYAIGTKPTVNYSMQITITDIGGAS